jgi:hypothetical protein
MAELFATGNYLVPSGAWWAPFLVIGGLVGLGYLLAVATRSGRKGD